ncbi:MAG TPA: hypothetical protein VMD30_06460 [Tepidisphaeraceae bacterium]|nr:hypothetical protein [Tepidisphaeraceae bacterium]
MSQEKTVEFARRGSACAGTFAGALIAIGVPVVALVWGHSLTSTQQFVVILCGIGVGGFIALTTAFFHAVTPSHVGGWGCCGCDSNSAANQPRSADVAGEKTEP